MAEAHQPPNEETRTTDNPPQDSHVNQQTNSHLNANPSALPSAIPGMLDTAGSGSSSANRGSGGSSSSQSRRKRRESTRVIPVPEKIGEYDILREIGRGGMGVVYEGTHQVLKKRVAIKMLLAQHAGQRARSEMIRFLAEGQAIAAIKHPHVVEVFDIGEDSDRAYLVMELCACGSFKQTLELSRPSVRTSARLRDAVEKLLAVARGVAAAHQHGIIHRDLKPDNVLFNDAGEPKVADFGLAKLREGSGLTLTEQVMGTPAYMSPEQASGHSKFVGPQADVWAIGVILYELLAGVRPFDGTTQEILAQVQNLTPTPPSKLARDVPYELELICLKCLAKFPQDRYPTAKELAEDLDRYLSGRPISVRRIGEIEQLWKWCRRNPVPAGLIAALLVLVGCTVTLARAVMQERDATEAARQREIILKKNAERDLAKSLVASARELRTSRPIGWTWTVQQKLKQAVDLQTDALDLSEVRSLVASCQATLDLRFAGVFGDGLESISVAFSPDSRRVAIAQWRNAWACKVQLYDVETRQLAQELSFSTIGNVLNTKTEDFGKHDGAEQIVFSPDGRWLVVQSRFGRLHRWDLSTRNPSATSWTAHKHGRAHHDLSFCEAEQCLYTIGPESWRWDLTKNWKGTRLPFNGGSISSSQDGQLHVVLDTDQKLQLYDGPTLIKRPFSPPKETGMKAALSRDGQLIALLDNNLIHLVSASDGRRLSTLTMQGEHGQVYGNGWVRFSPDGCFLASSCHDYYVHLWNLASGRLVAKLRIADQVRPVGEFSPDGRWLAITGHKKSYLYELSQPRWSHIAALQPDPIRAFAFLPTGQLVTLSEKLREGGVIGQRLATWSVATQQWLQLRQVELPGIDFRYRPKLRCSLAVHPRGDCVYWAASILGPSAYGVKAPLASPFLAGTSQLEAVRTWPLEQAKLPPAAEWVADPRSPSGQAICLRPSPDAQPLVIDFPKNLRQTKADGWMMALLLRAEKAQPGGEALQLQVVGAAPHVIDRSLPNSMIPDDAYQLYYPEAIRTEVFQKQQTTQAVTVRPLNGVKAVYVAAVYLLPITVKHWPGELTIASDYEYSDLHATPDGRHLWGIWNRSVIAWNLADHRIAMTWSDLEFAQITGRGPELKALAVGKDRVLVGTSGGILFALAADTAKKVWNQDLEAGIRSVAIDPTNTYAVVGTDRGQIYRVRLDHGEILTDQELPPHSGSVESVAFSPDGRWLATASLDQTVRLWQSSPKGYQPYLSLLADVANVEMLRFSPDGHLLGVLYRGERGVRLWDLDGLVQLNSAYAPARRD